MSSPCLTEPYRLSSCHSGDKLLFWCLVLFQQLFDSSDNQVVSYVMNELPDSNLREKFESIVVGSSERNRIELGLLGSTSEEDHKRFLATIIAIRESQAFCNIINKRIVEKFVTDYKEEGSFYATRQVLIQAFSKLFNFGDYGELGVYVSEGIPSKAFATIGEFGSLIRIKSMPPSEVFSVLCSLLERASTVSVGPEIGNMKFLKL